MPRHSFRAACVTGVIALLSLVPDGTVLGQSAYQTIAGTPHDFSGLAEAGGDGCAMCHIFAVPAGNKGGGVAFAAFAGRSGLDADGIPGPESHLCLSCHDGLGASDEVGFDVSFPGLEESPHPVSMVYDEFSTGGLRPVTFAEASGLKLYRLDGSIRVECTSCHDPHDNSNANFLRISNRGSAMCLGCHAK